MIAAMVRREILGMIVPPDAVKNAIVFQQVIGQGNEKIHAGNGSPRARLYPNGSKSSIELLSAHNRP
jgi:hypothetical protein